MKQLLQIPANWWLNRKIALHKDRIQVALQYFYGNGDGIKEYVVETDDGYTLTIKGSYTNHIKVLMDGKVVCEYSLDQIYGWSIRECVRFHFGSWVYHIYTFRDDVKRDLESKERAEEKARFTPLD